MKLVFLIFLLLFASYSKADVVDSFGTRWPIPSWNVASDREERMSTPECRNFVKFSTKSKKFLTDGLVVIKDGKLQYENYEKHYGPNIPHALWSVSKTITGILLGIAVRDHKITMDQNLNEFYPRSDAQPQYQNVKIKNLFYLDTGFIWDESYGGDVSKSSVINMLYGNGHRDMVDYVSSQKIITKGPGYLFNYSTGTPTITMGILKNVYGEDYNEMPWKNLFNPIGMTNVHFERDEKEVFNGGAAVFATPRDMARIGYLYLNKGLLNGKEILPQDWIDKTLTVSPGYLSKGTVIRDITDDGVFGGSIWLNRIVKKGFGKPFPTLPEDMFLAMGQFGQYIVILPTQKMVIARTGYDEDDGPAVDKFVSLALSCFADPDYPKGKIIPLPSYDQTGIPSMIQTLKTGLKSNILQAAVAKSICSCHFISGIDTKTCIAHSNIPYAKELTVISIKDNIVYSEQSFLAKKLSKILNLSEEEVAKAVFNQKHPEFGCVLK